ncbi:MAG: hypothetical protein ACI95C_000947 [Pseudohongiellaceae bacterium]|jgi:uncharacterized protein (DUF2164 family)
MAQIVIDAISKQEIIIKLKHYFETELSQELGGFEAEFLLDFFTKAVGPYYYNQGLFDGLKAIESKLEEFSDIVYQLEQPVQ